MKSSLAVVAGTAATVKIARAADQEIEILVAHWKKSKAFSVKVAETMPESDYSYKPFPDARSFGAEMVHLGAAEGHYLGLLGKGAAPAAPKGEPSKAAAVAYLNAVFDWSVGVVGQLTTADLTKTFGNGKMSMTGLELLYNAMIHTAHTRGYAEMFLRNKGVVPPPYSV